MEFRAPSKLALTREVRAAMQPVRLLANAPRLLRGPRADGAGVLVLPGFGTSDLATLPLRRYLDRRGFASAGWGLGTNTGDVEAFLERTIPVAEALADRAGDRISAVGWSLGGVIARELSRERPDLVRNVVTYGTPVVGGPRYTTAYSAYGEDEVQRIEALIAEANDTPIRVPVTALYTRNDGIVDWRACLDDHTPGVENIEVSSSHVGMGIDPDVWTIIIDRCLASVGAPAQR